MKSGLILNIEVVKEHDDYNWFFRANNVIPDNMIKKQTYDVDVVSGSTYSSKGIINAVKDALTNKKIK